MSINDNYLIWIDLEMTGLDPKQNRIIEIATVITDNNLITIAEGPTLAIYQSNNDLLLMNHWNLSVHSKNGLIEEVKRSKLNEEMAAMQTLTFLSKWVPAGRSPMCGNSIGHDRNFLIRYMPALEKYFHYRCLDVSTIKELACRWNPKITVGLNKKNNHRALKDIYESIAELNYYRKHFIRV